MLELRLSPAGSDPEEMLQVYGGLPACAASVAEYAVPDTAAGRTVVVSWMLTIWGPTGADSAEYPVELMAQTVTFQRTPEGSPVMVSGLAVPVALNRVVSVTSLPPYPSAIASVGDAVAR